MEYSDHVAGVGIGIVEQFFEAGIERVVLHARDFRF